MNKYILLTAIAGVAFASYCAYADNEATMTVTATVIHDVSLEKFGGNPNILLLINPAQTSGSLDCIEEITTGGVMENSLCDHFGFYANTPNYAATRLSVTPASKTVGTMTLNNWRITGSGDGDFYAHPVLSYTGGAPADGEHSFGEFTISYTPE
ncbi:MAG: hypothetical protein IJ689_03200 [Alphaproteobacteria bacterium]|nr:hypothetical protein [Alphaproteobacteria bacterium]